MSCIVVVEKTTIDPRIPTVPGRSTPVCHRPGRHCWHHAKSAYGEVVWRVARRVRSGNNNEKSKTTLSSTAAVFQTRKRHGRPLPPFLSNAITLLHIQPTSSPTTTTTTLLVLTVTVPSSRPATISATPSCVRSHRFKAVTPRPTPPPPPPPEAFKAVPPLGSSHVFRRDVAPDGVGPRWPRVPWSVP